MTAVVPGLWSLSMEEMTNYRDLIVFFYVDSICFGEGTRLKYRARPDGHIMRFLPIDSLTEDMSNYLHIRLNYINMQLLSCFHLSKLLKENDPQTARLKFPQSFKERLTILIS
jgi:hypothetical protein